MHLRVPHVGLHQLITHPSLALAGTWLAGLREWLALARARRVQGPSGRVAK